MALFPVLHKDLLDQGLNGGCKQSSLKTQRWAKEGHSRLSIEERRKVLFEKLELSGLEFQSEENKDKALDLLAEYHDIFMLKDGEMGSTEAAEHVI